MRKHTPFNLTLAFALALGLGILFAPGSALAQKISKTQKSGSYAITLKVLPAEYFTGSNAAMTRDGGAQPNDLNSSENPNHHLVAFVKKDGKPVEDASVAISYRRLPLKKNTWHSLPVVRMHVTGKSLATTHYGNNVRLEPGRYQVRVIVNGTKPVVFHFKLK